MPDNPMTEAGYDRLQKRIDGIRQELIPELERRLGEAREKGDLSENSEYDAARERLWEAERQKAELEAVLANAFPVPLPTEPSDTAAFGYVIDVRKIPEGPVESYHIVGIGESDVSNGLISFASPFAQGFINRRVGERVKVEVPAGVFEYEILAVRCP
jgi:transcription elongation factor GreA